MKSAAVCESPDLSDVPRDRVTGVILAGGRSSRMFPVGAGDKGLLPLGPGPMLGAVIARLRPQVGRLVLNANGDSGRFAAFDLPVIADATRTLPGPLAGILAGMLWSGTHAPAASHIVSVSCDAPFLPCNLVGRLVEGAAGEFSQAVATSQGRVHPVVGLWRVDRAGELAEVLARGERTVMAWADRPGTARVAFPDEVIDGRRVDPFFNVNTPAELAEARRLLEGSV